KPMKQVDVEIVGHHEKRHLEQERPAADETQSGHPARRGIQPCDQSRDDDSQNVALEKVVLEKVHEEPGAQQAMAGVAGQDPLEPDEHDRRRGDEPEHPTAGKCHPARASTSGAVNRSFFIAARSLSYTRLTPSPRASSTSRMSRTSF